MPTEVLACPSCRAPGPMGPDAHGEYRCIYCGTRFHRHPTIHPSGHPAAPAPVPVVVNVAPANNKSAAGVLIAAGLLVLVGAGAAFFLLLAPGEVSVEHSSPAHAPARVPAVAPTVAPTPPTHAAPSSISAPVPDIATPEPEPPASASFEFQRTQSGYKTSFYALGFVTNTSPFVIEKPKVIAVLLDAQGQELGTDFGFAERDVLAPDERSPIKILISEPPEHASIRYEVIARKASYIPVQAEGLRIETMPPRPAQFGKDTWELEGKVHNEGSQSARFVSVEIQALDVNGKLVGLGTTYADGEVLGPGGVARFSTQIMLADKADHFEFVLGNRIAD
jgi:hypothetical protein